MRSASLPWSLDTTGWGRATCPSKPQYLNILDDIVGWGKTTWCPSQLSPQCNYNTSIIGWQYRLRKDHMLTLTSTPTSIHKHGDDNIGWGCTHVHPYLKTSIRLRSGFNTLYGPHLDLIRPHPCTKEFLREFISILGWNYQMWPLHKSMNPSYQLYSSNQSINVTKKNTEKNGFL